MSIERLRALEKAVELVAKATPGPWMVSDHNEGEMHPLWCVDNEAFHTGGDEDQPLMVSVQYGGKEDAEAIRAAVNFIREHGSALIAELGQEVGAVYAHPVELEAARRNYARGLADGLLTVSVQPIPGFVPLYNSSATPTAAADSERLDWVINHPGQVVTKWGHESSWHVVGAITGHIISRGHASYREAIDAAMRQARRTRRPLDFTATGR